MTNDRPIHRINYQLQASIHLIDQWQASMTSFFICTIKSFDTIIIVIQPLVVNKTGFNLMISFSRKAVYNTMRSITINFFRLFKQFWPATKKEFFTEISRKRLSNKRFKKLYPKKETNVFLDLTFLIGILLKKI